MAAGVDGIAIVMLTYGPAMRTVRALLDTPVPLMLANIQPERSITADWDMADLTYNQGIHGAQDQANALVRAGVPFSVITGDWRSAEFARAFEDWARAAQAVTALRRTRIGAARLPDERHGRHPLRPAGAAAADRPDDRQRGPRRRWSTRIDAVSDADVDAVLARARRAVRGRDRPAARAPRVRRAVRGGDPRRCSRTRATPGFSFHFDSIGGDGRFKQLPLLAASDLMADGYGFAAEGDTNTATLMCAAQTMIGDAHFSEMYAMDWELDSVLISHMGEGNWKIARTRPAGAG